jgi:hypothetical protein
MRVQYHPGSAHGVPVYDGPVAGARRVVVEGSFDARMARAAGVSAVARPAAFLV